MGEWAMKNFTEYVYHNALLLFVFRARDLEWFVAASTSTVLVSLWY